MAGKSGTTTRAKPRPLRYFFLNNKLHKKLHINRGADTIWTWCYPDGKRVAYTYSDVLRNKKPAFSTRQVCMMLMRSRDSVERAILRGDIAQPPQTYTIDERRKPFAFYWAEDDVMAAHAYFSTVHRGRPRKDGLITPQKLPTARELRAMLRDENILYVREGDEYRPTWRANE